MTLAELTEDNWKRLAPNIARERFPTGSLVHWGRGFGVTFGKVTKIQPSGRIYVSHGELELIDLKLDGSYRVTTYDTTTFKETPLNDEAVIRFMPHYDDGELNWHTSERLLCRRLEPVDTTKKLFKHTGLDY